MFMLKFAALTVVIHTVISFSVEYNDDENSLDQESDYNAEIIEDVIKESREFENDNMTSATEPSNHTTDDPTVPDIVDTTPTISTTESPDDPQDIKCPTNQTAYVRGDLELIVNQTIINIKLTESLNDFYYKEAVDVRNKHMERLDGFHKKIENRPEHLKDVLLDLSKTREETIRLIHKVQSHLEKYKSTKDNAHSVISKSNDILKQLDQYKILCSFCDDKTLIKAKVRTGSIKLTKKSKLLPIPSLINTVYCSTYDKLIKFISNNITSFEIDYQQILIKRVKEADAYFEEKLSTLIIQLKEVALKEFGMTMYNILSLQDDYFHLNKSLVDINDFLETNELGNEILQISNMSLVLEREVHKYGKKCQRCLNLDTRVFYQKMNADLSRALLQEVLSDQIDIVKSIVESNYESIFRNLNSTLNDPNINEEFFTNLRPIQKDLADEISKKQTAFEEIYAEVPKVTDEYTILEETKEVSKQIEEALEYLMSNVP